MNMLRYYPWSVFNPLQHEAARAFTQRAQKTADNSPSNEWAPAVDIREEAERYVILADVPGIDAKDIDIQAEQGVLTIKGERSQVAAAEHNLYKRVERLRGPFVRRFTLPDAADTEHITARSHSGVLEVVIPKAPAVQARKVVVTE